jgi:hypothetical protein
MQNLLLIYYEKILLLNTFNFGGDYRLTAGGCSRILPRLEFMPEWVLSPSAARL